MLFKVGGFRRMLEAAWVGVLIVGDGQGWLDVSTTG